MEKGDCQGCQAVQRIVDTNEQMIQEQIKIIKSLHQENSLLQQRNSQLELELKQFQHNKEVSKEEGVQTEWAFEGPSEQLRVSTRVNIQGASRKSSTSSDLSKENLHEMVPLHSISKN